MRILAFETSCDDTGIAIVENGQKVIANLLLSQSKSHRKYGGVFPELASRMHCESIIKLLIELQTNYKLTSKNIDAIAVTQGPGLEGSLLVGQATAKVFSKLWKRPLIGVNHLKGHIFSSFLNKSQELIPKFPFIALIISGGHTMLVKVIRAQKMHLLGQTRDDAVGEAYDKVARLLGLGYPGGPDIEKKAMKGNQQKYNFPRAMKHSPLEFSFSGLKTSIAQTVSKIQDVKEHVDDICASFQKAVIDVLIHKTMQACKYENISNLIVSGGVISNNLLRKKFQQFTIENNIILSMPEMQFCTDNAAMIASAAYFNKDSKENLNNVLVQPNLSI